MKRKRGVLEEDEESRGVYDSGSPSSEEEEEDVVEERVRKKKKRKVSKDVPKSMRQLEVDAQKRLDKSKKKKRKKKPPVKPKKSVSNEIWIGQNPNSSASGKSFKTALYFGDVGMNHTESQVVLIRNFTASTYEVDVDHISTKLGFTIKNTYYKVRSNQTLPITVYFSPKQEFKLGVNGHMKIVYTGPEKKKKKRKVLLKGCCDGIFGTPTKGMDALKDRIKADVSYTKGIKSSRGSSFRVQKRGVHFLDHRKFDFEDEGQPTKKKRKISSSEDDLSKDLTLELIESWSKDIPEYIRNISSLQSSVRSVFAVKHLTNELDMIQLTQNCFRRTIVMLDQTVRKYSIIIQSTFRQQKISSIVDDRQKIIDLQSVIRQKAVAPVDEVVKSAEDLQRAVRYMLLKRDLEQSIESVTLVQSVVRKNGNSSENEKDVSAVTDLQSVFRQSLKSEKFKKEKEMVENIQSLVRSNITPKIASERNQIVGTQSWIRFNLVGKKESLRDRLNSVVLFQSCGRTFLNNSTKKDVDALKDLQSVIRSSQLIKNREYNLKSLTNSVIDVQSVFRGALQKKKLLVEGNMIKLLQSAMRTSQETKIFESMFLRTRDVQKLIRKNLLSKKFGNDLSSIVLLQSAIRNAQLNHLGKARGQPIISHFVSLVKNVQMLTRKNLLQKALFDARDRILCCQRVMKTNFQKECLNGDCNSIALLQSVVRKNLAKNSFSRMKNSVLAVQMNLRAVFARKRHLGGLDSIILLQNAIRASAEKRNFVSNQRALIILCQQVVKGKLFEKNASIQHRVGAVAFVQAVVRKNLAKSQFMKKQIDVTDIQCVARKRLMLMRLFKDVQSIKNIQKLVRSNNVVLKRKNDFSNIVNVQKIIRRNLKSKQFERSLTRAKDLQCVVRKDICCMSLFKDIQSIKNLQRQIRSYLDVLKRKNDISSIVNVQKIIRRNLESKQFERSLTRVKDVQCGVRKDICGMSLFKDIQSIKNLQRQIRSNIDVLKRKNDISSIVNVQKIIRRNLESNQFERSLTRVKDLQCVVRKDICGVSLFKDVQSIKNLQRQIRSNIDVLKRKNDICSIVNVQKLIRRNLKSKQFDRSLTRVKDVQCGVRKNICVDFFAQRTRSLVLLQSAVRKDLCSLRKVDDVQMVVLVQSLLRRNLSKLVHKRRVDRVVALQGVAKSGFAEREMQVCMDGIVLTQSVISRNVVFSEYSVEKAVGLVTIVQSVIRKLNVPNVMHDLHLVNRVQGVVRKNVEPKLLQIREKIVDVQKVIRKNVRSAALLRDLDTVKYVQCVLRKVITRNDEKLKDLYFFELDRRVEKRRLIEEEKARIAAETRTAINVLLNYKNEDLTRLISASGDLKKFAKISLNSCMMINTVEFINHLFNLIQELNRSEPHMCILENILDTMLHISFQLSGGDLIYKCKNSVSIILDQLQKLRNECSKFLRVFQLLLNITRGRKVEDKEVTRVKMFESQLAQRIKMQRTFIGVVEDHESSDLDCFHKVKEFLLEHDASAKERLMSPVAQKKMKPLKKKKKKKKKKVTKTSTKTKVTKTRTGRISKIPRTPGKVPKKKKKKKKKRKMSISEKRDSLEKM